MAPNSRSLSKPTRMLVPVDFSSSSVAALLMARELAGFFKAELLLLNVIPMFPAYAEMGLYPEGRMLEDARDVVQLQLASRVKELISLGLQARSEVQIGNDVVGNIMMTIDEQHIDMVVLSTHGMSGWRPAVFGSIAAKIIKLVECPVMLLHTPKPEPVVEEAGATHAWNENITRVLS